MVGLSSAGSKRAPFYAKLRVRHNGGGMAAPAPLRGERAKKARHTEVAALEYPPKRRMEETTSNRSKGR
jgi:hypothetical protein